MYKNTIQNGLVKRGGSGNHVCYFVIVIISSDTHTHIAKLTKVSLYLSGA